MCPLSSYPYWRSPQATGIEDLSWRLLYAPRIQPWRERYAPNVVIPVVPTLHALGVGGCLIAAARNAHGRHSFATEEQRAVVGAEPRFGIGPGTIYNIAEMDRFAPQSSIAKGNEEIDASIWNSPRTEHDERFISCYGRIDVGIVAIAKRQGCCSLVVPM